MISVIGGAGFIGTNIYKTLNKKFEFRIFDNGFNPSTHLQYHPLEIGTASLDELKENLYGSSTIINLAAHTRVLDSIADPNLSFVYNVKGFFEVLMAARSLGVKRVINASSGGAIVGDALPPINEVQYPQPISPYGASKLANEAFSSAFTSCYDLQIINLRFSNVYGAFCQNKESVVAKFIKNAIRGEILEIYGDGNQTRDFLHVDDLVNAVEICLKNDSISGVFQLGSGVPTSVNELIQKINFVTGLNTNVRHTEANNGEIKRNFADISKAKKAMAWIPQKSLDAGIMETYEYLQHVLNDK